MAKFTLRDMLSPKRDQYLDTSSVPKVSSFKVSNKVKKRQLVTKKEDSEIQFEDPGRIDIDLFHEKKMQYFDQLQTKLLPRLKNQIKTAAPEVKPMLQVQIENLESKVEERSYLAKCIGLVDEFKMLKQKVKECAPMNASGTIILRKHATDELNQVMNRYYTIVDPTKVNLKHLFYDYLQCEDCQGPMYLNGGLFSCDECGLVSKKVIGDYQWSYKDIQDIQYKSSFSYKRINRFKEILSMMQAKENTDIPDQVIDAIRSEMNKELKLDKNNITIQKVRYYLKKTGNNRYYEHAPSIINRVIGQPPLRIDQATEDKLMDMFTQIQQPFEQVRQTLYPTRSSFLSYPYVFHKFFELMDRKDCMQFFPLLKSTEKLKVQDKIWQAMCEILNWPFHASI